MTLTTVSENGNGFALQRIGFGVVGVEDSGQGVSFDMKNRPSGRFSRCSAIFDRYVNG
jgi:hypothetical protein